MDGGSSGDEVARRAKPVRIEFERLANAGKSFTGPAGRHLQTDRVLHVVVGSGRSSVLHANAVPPAVLIPLRGRVRIVDGDGVRVLPRGRMLVTEGGQQLQVFGSAPALWIALIAPAFVWRQLAESTVETSIPEPILLPVTQNADRAIRRAAIRLARDASRSGAARAHAMASALAFAMLLFDRQTEFDATIDRCPGRTLAQRRGVFTRMQRVCNYIESSSDLDLGIAGFARMVNYSSCHFVRTFSAIYGKTPHAALIEQRLKRALWLVSETELSITEVARTAGFEDRCAFARSFKRRFGKTARSMREASEA